MNKLVQTIESIRQKLPNLHRHVLKETPTRTIVIDPLLEALGWDVRDPDEVQLEYPTIDGKSVDYALKINKKVVLLVEAKALGDSLDDVKGVTQVVGYAANDGIVWCILTNGIKWRIYRSVEKCSAPDKLMYEVSLDPESQEEMSATQVARQMWRFSCEEMAKGALDVLGEQTFTDGKVRKSLLHLMANPPRPFLNLLRSESGDSGLTPQQIRESLKRVAEELFSVSLPKASAEPINEAARPPKEPNRSLAASKAWGTRRAKQGESRYDEAHHLGDRPKESIALYQALERLCMAFSDTGVHRTYMKKTINFIVDKSCFCSVHVLRSGLRVWVPLRFGHIPNPPSFARDVSNVGHWGPGDVELRIGSLSDLEEARAIIHTAFEETRK